MREGMRKGSDGIRKEGRKGKKGGRERGNEEGK